VEQHCVGALKVVTALNYHVYLVRFFNGLSSSTIPGIFFLGNSISYYGPVIE
jgi:hypothetical protein